MATGLYPRLDERRGSGQSQYRQKGEDQKTYTRKTTLGASAPSRLTSKKVSQILRYKTGSPVPFILMTDSVMKIALLGPSNAGKTTSAQFLQSSFGYEVIRTGPIVRGISDILFGNQSKANLSRVARAISVIGSNIVLEAALRNARSSDRLVLDSVRNPAELEYVKQRGFVLLKILRTSQGESEIPQDQFETFHQNVECKFTYENDGTKEALHAFITSILDDDITGGT